jgi:hypothetical protein
MARSEDLLGRAVFERWADLPRDIQELLFEAAVSHEPEARDLLAPVYGEFTEGFDEPDLRAAKTLLAELS